jgi:hypothetical protein
MLKGKGLDKPCNVSATAKIAKANQPSDAGDKLESLAWFPPMVSGRWPAAQASPPSTRQARPIIAAANRHKAPFPFLPCPVWSVFDSSSGRGRWFGGRVESEKNGGLGQISSRSSTGRVGWRGYTSGEAKIRCESSRRLLLWEVVRRDAEGASNPEPLRQKECRIDTPSLERGAVDGGLDRPVPSLSFAASTEGERRFARNVGSLR